MNDKKKIIIIAIILFIFLGLTVFTFANPSDEAENSGSGSKDEVKEEDKTNEKEDKEENEEESVNNETDNTQANNNVPVVNTLTDNSYDVAEEAVINAEDKVDEESYNNALELVDKVTNEEQKEELNNRLDEVKNGIDAKALVATLESKTNSAANKKDMDGARDYRTEEQIETLVANLTNEDLRSELQATLATLAQLLDDNTIEINIEDGAILNSTTTIEVKDENEVTITLTKGEDSKEIENGTEITDGVYTLTVTDAAFNSKTITFTIDTTSPVFVGYPESGFTAEDFVINVDDLTDVTITISKRNASEDEGYPKTVENGYVITGEGSYILEAIDAVGNKIRVNLGVDKNAPQVTGVEDGKHYKTSVTPIVTDLQLAGAIRLNGEKYTSGTEITEEGDYTLVATDRVGRTTTVTFTIDKSAPTITKVPDGKIVNHSVSPKIEDINLDTVTLIKNGVEVKNYQDNMYELSHEGTYEITACDKAGNCTTVSFEIDKTAPGTNYVEIRNLNQVTEGYAKVGDMIWVTVTLNEQLSKKPEIKINGATATFIQEDVGENYYQYTAETVMTEDMAEGEIQFTIDGYKDLAGNPNSEVLTNADINHGVSKIILDKTAPEATNVEIKGITKTPGYAKVGDEIWVGIIANEELGKVPTITINGVVGEKVQEEINASGHLYYAKVIMTEEMAEGEIKFTIEGYKDLAGNSGETLTNDNINNGLSGIILDKTAPEATNVEIKGITKTPGYAKVGDEIWVGIIANEELGKLPTITINGVVGEKVQEEINASGHLYYAKVIMTEEMAEGEIQFTIEGYEDLAGNKGETLTNADINLGLEKIELDKSAPGTNYVEIRNLNQVTEGYAKVGDMIWVTVTLNEQLSKKPEIKINGATATFIQEDVGENYYQYTAETVMTEDMAEGEIQFTIDGYEDLAGNPNSEVLTNADINHGVSKIILDKTAPGYNYVGIMNIDQVTEGYAKVGDRVWVYVIVDEYVSKEPTITINGVKAKIVQTEDGAKFNDTWYKYVGEVVMTKEMAEGEIEFTIDGYKDLAGNSGETLTNDNINNGLLGIILDKTAATVNAQLNVRDGAYDLSFTANEELQVKDNITKEVDGSYKLTTTEMPKDLVVYDNAGNKTTVPVVTEMKEYKNPHTNVARNVYIEFTFSKEVNNDDTLWIPADYAKNIKKQFDTNGDKTIKFYDKDGNTLVVNYAITKVDETAPTAEMTINTRNGYELTFTPSEDIHDIEGYTKKEDGTYSSSFTTLPTTLEIMDMSGNTTVLPVITAVSEYKNPYTNVARNVYIDFTFNKEVNNDETMWIPADYAKNVKKQFDTNGDKSVKFYDKDGNKLLVEFAVKTVDTEAPTVTGVTENGEYNKSVVITATDDKVSADKITATIDGVNYVLGTEYSIAGKHVLKVSDNSGNTTTRNFIIGKMVNNATELTTAVANAQDGDYIYLKNATYNVGTLHITKNITLAGESKDNVKIVVSDQIYGQAGLYVQAEATLENLTVEMTNNAYAAIKVSKEVKPLTRLQTATIKNVNVIGGYTGINIHGVANATVDNVNISSTSKTAMSIASSDVVIINSTIGNAAWGSIGIMWKINDEQYPVVSNVTMGNGNKVAGGIYVDKDATGTENKFTFVNEAEFEELEIDGVAKAYIQK